MEKKNLLDFELEVIESRRGSLTIAIRSLDIEWRGIFSYDGADFFSPASANERELLVALGSEEIPIVDYLS